MHILLVDCPDCTGIVYKITKALFERQLNIERNDEFVDQTTGHFFMRTAFSGDFRADDLMTELQRELSGARIRLRRRQPKNIVIMATKEPHCLGDLLIRHAYDQLEANIVAVVANHDTLRPLVEKFGIPFHLVSHKGKTRRVHEAEVIDTLDGYEFEYIVLAKYMRILQPAFVERYKNKLLNIHHSFLPAFIGANPYGQAFQRGVKIIGATAHFVTDNLDEGPIIEQDVARVGHRMTAKQLAQVGKDVEKIVLARALKLVLADRVFIHGNKTVIF